MNERKPLVRQASAEMRSYQTAVDRFDEVVVGLLGINRTDGRCLDILEQRGAMTAGDLARHCGLTSGAMTTLLDRLEQLGYLRRVPHPTDRRRVLVELTAKARRRIGKIYGPVGEEGSTLLAQLSDEQLALIRDVMRTGRELLERHTERIEQMRARQPGRAGKKTRSA